ncbi:MAG: aminoacyl-tRNA hydrolase [Clostridia bacterium]|nr:aminoacyl-tRNA hydrolase [Clostridia bacterium]
MYLIAGLGNIGHEYENTRHNVGFKAVDYLAWKKGVKINRLKFRGAYAKCAIAGEPCILLKPYTYMNLSGESVREAVEYFRIDDDKIIIIYDDFELDVGRIRIRRHGSAGTHNGMKSIIYQLGSDAFPRIRFGVGKVTHDCVDHVLGRFSEEEAKMVTAAIKNTDDIVEFIVRGEIDAAMSKYNGFGTKEQL